MSGGVTVWISRLDNDEMETLLQAKRLRFAATHGVQVYRSTTDTSAAARHRKTHYDRMD